jgi:hypothetical protein
MNDNAKTIIECFTKVTKRRVSRVLVQNALLTAVLTFGNIHRRRLKPMLEKCMHDKFLSQSVIIEIAEGIIPVYQVGKLEKTTFVSGDLTVIGDGAEREGSQVYRFGLDPVTGMLTVQSRVG